MSASVVSPIALLVFAAAAWAGPTRMAKSPRPPTTNLGAWQCTACSPAGKPIEMLDRTVAELAERCGITGDWVAIETPRLRLFCSLRKATTSAADSEFAATDLEQLRSIFPRLNRRSRRMTLNTHQRAHLYQIRIERMYRHFVELTGNRRRWLGMTAPYEVFLFDEADPHRFVARDLLGNKNVEVGARAARLGPTNSFAFTTAGKLFHNRDRDLHNNVRHHVAHNLVNGYGNFYRNTWAFLEVGLAHYFERRERSDARTLCHGGTLARVIAKKSWPRRVRDLVRKRKDRFLSRWCEKLHPQELEPEEHMLAWSLVDWMVRTDPERLAALLDRVDDVENRPTAAEAIAEVYGIPPDALHRRWREDTAKRR